ncbi:MAG: hypothetical protein AAF677_06500 [Pseudomonadota bacterium]
MFVVRRLYAAVRRAGSARVRPPAAAVAVAVAVAVSTLLLAAPPAEARSLPVAGAAQCAACVVLGAPLATVGGAGGQAAAVPMLVGAGAVATAPGAQTALAGATRFQPPTRAGTGTHDAGGWQASSIFDAMLPFAGALMLMGLTRMRVA